MSDRGMALVVAVAAPAEGGRANAAVRAALAEAFGVRARDVRIFGGLRSRDKIAEIDGDETFLAGRLTALYGR